MTEVASRIPKAALFKAIGYEIHAEEVADFHNSRARRRVPVAPARTSKSMSTAAELAAEGLPTMTRDSSGKLWPTETRLNWSVGPDYGTNKEFDYIHEWFIDKNILSDMGMTVTRAYNSPNQGNMQIVAECGKAKDGKIVRAIWEGKSATNHRALQGEQLHACAMSEAAEQDETIWSKYLRTRCHYAYFPTTPKVKARWLWKLKKGRDVANFTFRPKANPKYDYQNFWMEHAASEAKFGPVLTNPPEFDEVGRALTPPEHECLLYRDGKVIVNPDCVAAQDPEFAEQFLGQWTFQMGKILPFNSDPTVGSYCNVVQEVPEWVYGAKWMWSFDYGYEDPYVGMLWALGPDQWCIMDSFYKTKQSDPEIAHLITEAEDRAALNFGARVEYYAPDPRQPQLSKMLTRELQRTVYPLDKGAMSDRAAGHRLLVNELKPQASTGLPGLVILGTEANQPVINEWDSLCSKDGNYANEWGTTALDGPDHAFDCGKYGGFTARIVAPKRKANDWLRDFKKIRKRVMSRPVNSPTLAGANPEIWSHA